MSFRIVVGAGHGGNGSTPGKRTPDGEYEWNFNDVVADAFVAEIAMYRNVDLLRVDDDDASDGLVDVSLGQRVREANAFGADLYISFHQNALAGKWGSHGGTETYYYEGSSVGKSVAKVVQKASLDTLGLRDRGIKRGNHLYIIKNSAMPCILLEGGFMDSTSDIKVLRNDKKMAELGRNVAKAVAKYFGLAKGSTSKGSGKAVSKPMVSKPAPAKKPSFKGDRTIQSIQDTLNNRYNTRIAEDGLYGGNTKKALVKGFQTELNRQFNAGLVVDGIWGAKTKQASVNVRKSARGNLTYLLQAALYCRGYNPNGVDGIFGKGTEEAVRKFQRASGLSADGIAGKNTFDKLFR